MKESAVEALLRNEVKRIGGMSSKIAPVDAGAPDRLVILPGGRIYLVELKQDKGRLRPIQKHWHAEAAKRGVSVITLHGTEQVRNWIHEQEDDHLDQG